MSASIGHWVKGILQPLLEGGTGLRTMPSSEMRDCQLGALKGDSQIMQFMQCLCSATEKGWKTHRQASLWPSAQAFLFLGCRIEYFVYIQAWLYLSVLPSVNSTCIVCCAFTLEKSPTASLQMHSRHFPHPAALPYSESPPTRSPVYTLSRFPNLVPADPQLQPTAH